MAERRADIYTRITAEIVAAIEAGAGTWKMPWHHDGGAVCRPTNVGLERRYRGVNVIALWVAAQAAGCVSGVWGTYRQWPRSAHRFAKANAAPPSCSGSRCLRRR